MGGDGVEINQSMRYPGFENSGKKSVLATEAMRCSRLIAWLCGLAVVCGEVDAQAFGAHAAAAVLVAA